MFYFRNDAEKSLACVPNSWVQSVKKHKAGGTSETEYRCWWPVEGSKEAMASTFCMLVSNCSEPDHETWRQHKGVKLGTFQDLQKCHLALEKYEYISSTDTDDIPEILQNITTELKVQAKKDQRTKKQKENDQLAELFQAVEGTSETTDSDRARRTISSKYSAGEQTPKSFNKNTLLEKQPSKSVTPACDSLPATTASTHKSFSSSNLKIVIDHQTPLTPQPFSKPTGIMLLHLLIM